MRGIAFAAAAAAVVLAGAPAPAATKLPNDVSIKMKVTAGNTVSPLAKLTVKNLGTSTQNGVQVKVFAENEAGLQLWSGAVDLPPGKSAVLLAHCFLDQDTTTLVAVASPAGAQDGDPTDNIARAGLGLAGKAALAIVGRSIHLAHCASCHGQGGAGLGGAPSIVGAASTTILAKAAAGGNHAVPWLSKTDAKNLSTFLKDPAGVVMPPSLPPAPQGGWPTYQGSVKTLLDAKCVGCHGPLLATAGVFLDTYSGAVGNATRALLAMQLGLMPKSGGKLPAADIQVVQDWITGGMRP
jgi:mono/diheme cytochrome c family protein